MSKRIEPGPNQESVWDYPRPPALETVEKRLRVVFNGETIADTTTGYRVLETSHPPTYYIPPEDIAMNYLNRESRTSRCEFKGRAVYYSVTVGERSVQQAGWAYPAPTQRFTEIADHVSFYASKMGACFVGDEQARAQEGDFYGGWITESVVGPFKGGPGTLGW